MANLPGGSTGFDPTYDNSPIRRVSLVDSSGSPVPSGSGGSSSSNVQGAVAHDAVATSVNPVLGGGYASASAPTDVSADGDAVRAWFLRNGAQAFINAYLQAGEDLTNSVQGVAQKPVASSTYSGTGFMAPLNDVDISVKAAAGNLLSISASNINAAIRYLQVHNKATAPTGGDTPVFSFAIPAGSSTAPAIREVGREFFGENGHYLSTGIAIGISTTAATFTAATTTDHTTNGTYV